MAIQPRFRIAAALGALIAPMAVVAITATPADAAISKHKHEVTMYKVEKYIKLKGGGATSPTGDTLETSLSCSNSSDKVLDGMWLVQHVDQYNQPPTEPTDPDDDTGYDPIDPAPYTGGTYNDARDVQVWWSYPDTTDGYKWNFKFQNFAYGDAQLKTYITCIKGKTEANGHTHNIGVSGADALAGGLTVGVRSGYDWAGGCNADRFFVAPGFKIINGVRTRPVASYPTLNAGITKWHWDFAGAGASINYYGKCIERRVANAVGSGGNHSHGIAIKNLPTFSGHEYQIDAGDPQTEQFSCDEDNSTYHGYKAMVGWYWMGTNWEYNWFLGMEPQPKTRVFSFWNWHPSSSDAQITIGAVCVNSRTGNPINPI
ncbi:MAG TPA: hypothetical protein VGE14_14845 [Marmoricola sp.]